MRTHSISGVVIEHLVSFSFFKEFVYFIEPGSYVDSQAILNVHLRIQFECFTQKYWHTTVAIRCNSHLAEELLQVFARG